MEAVIMRVGLRASRDRRQGNRLICSGDLSERVDESERIAMCKRVYLDHNAIADVYQKRRAGLRELIDARKKLGDIFPYSPAHMEEIAVVLRSQPDQAQAQQMVADQIALVAELSDTWEILPGHQNAGPSRLLQEDPDGELLPSVITTGDASEMFLRSN